MALHPGTRIGAYEIGGKVGEGGMGEVYRARDTILHRDVIVVLNWFEELRARLNRR